MERDSEKKILNKIFKLTDGLVDMNDFFLSSSSSRDLSEIHKEIKKMVLNIREKTKRSHKSNYTNRIFTQTSQCSS